jgi:formate-nitrite transporter family protein
MATFLSHPVTDRDHTQGLPGAPVTLVEYGDYECPHCGNAFPVLGDIRQMLGDALRFAYRHYPINLSHTRAQMAAEAAEAAGEQGRFWEMHAKLFINQDALDRQSLERYAIEIGLDVARFQMELATGTYRNRVLEDVQSAEESGVSWTPTFFINDVRFGYAQDLNALIEALRTAAEESTRSRRGVIPARGVPR